MSAPNSTSRRSVWPKVGLVILLPVLATAVVVGNGLREGLETGRNVDQARELARVGPAASGDLVHGVQDERAAAAKLLAQPPSQVAKNREAFDKAGDGRPRGRWLHAASGGGGPVKQHGDRAGPGRRRPAEL